MYQVESSGQVLKARRGFFRGPAVSGTVIGLGWTSFFTDISSEMVMSVLPIYLLFSLQLSPLQFGFIDGLQQGASALVRLLGGYISDRWGRYKLVAFVGYALSAVSKVGLLAVGAAWSWIAGLVLVDRVGKGLRVAPRDAMISLSTDNSRMGAAFGVHRAFDTAGAMLGPILAFGLLALVPGGYDVVFVVSVCMAVMGLAALWLFVPSRHTAAKAEDEVGSQVPGTVSIAAVGRLLKGAQFRRLVLAGSLLALATISDSFIYLIIQQRMQLNVGFFPLLFVVTALAYMIFAIPMGRLADRFGKARVFLCGYVMLLLVYSLLLHKEIGWATLLLYLTLLGAYYAATDGVLMALASQGIDPSLRGSGLAVLGTAIGIARLVSSVAFGLVWTQWGLDSTMIVFTGMLGLTTLIAAWLVLSLDRHQHAT